MDSDTATSGVALADVAKANCALIDATTYRLLCDARLKYFLEGTQSRFLTAQPLPVEVAPYAADLNRLLNVLARMVAYDFVVVDTSVAEFSFWEKRDAPSERPLGGDLVRTMSVPAEVYRVCAASVLNAAGFVHYDPAVDHWLQDSDAWDPVEKKHFDERVDPQSMSWIRNSDQSLARALLYVELARYASAPVFLSAEKEQKLANIGHRFIRDALHIVQQEVDQAVFKSLNNSIRDLYGRQFDIPYPPLVRYIVSVAYRHGLPVWDAAQRIRDLPAAVVFRSWLAKLQHHLLAGSSSADLLYVQQTLATLSAIAEQWGAECGSSFGIRYRTARADLGSLPLLGTVFKIAGHATAEIKDPLLARGIDYLNFISEWYAPVPSGDAG